MRGLIFLLVLGLTAVGCGTSQKAAKSEVVVKERFKLVVQFNSNEDVKRVPFRLSHLRMELSRQIDGADNLYEASLYCKAEDLEGIINKLPLEEGIAWVERLK